GSIVVGLYQDGELVFAGHVGGGFGGTALKDLHAFMKPLETKTCPFARVPKTNGKAHWVAPKLVAEAEFAEWTEDGLMRQPIYMGLRPDKDPKACVRESAQPLDKLKKEARPAKIPVPEKKGTALAKKSAEKEGSKKEGPETAAVLTHPDKKLWPADGFTKKDLFEYYRSVSPFLLPHIKDRPLILKRFPNGIDAPPFYQHDVPSAPAFVKILPVKEEDGSEVHYVLCQNAETLLWLANLGAIPMHPWLSRTPHLARPDWIVFDLDPQEVPFPEVCGMALYLKEILDGLGLKTWVKTSGSRGIHIYLPLKPGYDFSQSLAFSQLVAEYAVRQKPDLFTVERSLKLRKRDRIYLDCMQNSEGKSVASVYSAREKPGATVSAALEWGELKKKIAIEDFNIRSMPKRLAKKGDLFKDVLRGGNALEAGLKKLEKLM
ncbi:MAG: non-homologous end-joining DNA ligase, partial [Fibrobacteria bacterium]